MIYFILKIYVQWSILLSLPTGFLPYCSFTNVPKQFQLNGIIDNIDTWF